MIFSIKTSEKVVALTFDDGPNPDATPGVLEILETYDVKATFFLCGKHVDLYPELVKAIHAKGHEIGNHTWTHKSLFHFFKKVPLQEMQRTNKAIADLTGEVPRLFRPPRLIQGLGANKALKILSLQSIAGWVHGRDWKTQDYEKITGKVVASVKPGSIIVLHDGDADAKPGETQQPRGGTVEAVKHIITVMQARGYRFVSIGELLVSGT